MNVSLFRFPISLGAAFACCLVASAQSKDPSDGLTKLSVDWVKTRSEAVRVETEWASQRELLDSTSKALAERARQTEEKRDLLRAKTSKEREELDALELQNQKLSEQYRRLEECLKSTDARLAEQRSKLPPRLSQALDLPLKSLADPALSPGDRVAHTMTVLNRCHQFSRCVTFGEEIVAVPGEARPKLMQTVYWGLSHGYAYDKVANKAWLGAPKAGGWLWEPCASVDSVRALIDSFGDKVEPHFIAVPARLSASFKTEAERRTP